MTFRLSNAPASFQNYNNKILIEKLDIFVIVYLDNIFIYTKDPGTRRRYAVGSGHSEKKWLICQAKKVLVS